MWPSGILLLVVVTLLVIGFAHFWLYKWRVPKCEGRLPPGSMGLPFIGETFQLFTHSKSIDIHPFTKTRTKKYGRIFKTNLAGRPVVISSDPEFNNYLFKQEGRLVEMWYMDTFENIINSRGDRITSTGHIHKVLRGMIMKNVGGLALQEMIFPYIEGASRDTLSRWCDLESVNVHEEITSMSFDFAAKHLYGLEPEKNMVRIFGDIIDGVMSFPLNIPGTAYNKCLKNRKLGIKMMKDLLIERQLNPGKHRGDLVDQFVNFMKTESFLTNDFAVVTMFVVLFASFKTLSASMTAAIILLSEHPMILKQLEEEHAGIIQRRGKGEDKVTWTEYKSMNLTIQVINESLRLANIAGIILRRAMKDIQYNGYTIPKGWTIMIPPEAIHLDPEFFKDPLSFDPRRWKDFETNVAEKIFMPFGGGGRMCAGADYTKAFMAIFIHILVSKYRFEKVKGGEITRSPMIGFGDGFYIKIRNKGTA